MEPVQIHGYHRAERHPFLHRVPVRAEHGLDRAPHVQDDHLLGRRRAGHRAVHIWQLSQPFAIG